MLAFSHQESKTQDIRDDFAGLSPTDLAARESEIWNTAASVNLLQGRATQRQVLQAIQDSVVPPPKPELPTSVPTRPPIAPSRSKQYFPTQRDPLLSPEGALSRELASEESRTSGATEEWMRYATHIFPSSDAEQRVE